MFFELTGEIYREILKTDEGSWIISFESPSEPKFVTLREMERFTKILPPEEYIKAQEMKNTNSKGIVKRFSLINELIKSPELIADKKLRCDKIRELAAGNKTTERRIRQLYFRQLAGRSLIKERKAYEKGITDTQRDFIWAINKFYYSAKKMSLRTAYDLMLLAKYTDPDGNLKQDTPTWHSFRHFFYDNQYHKRSKNSISRNGLSDYQRNKRQLHGNAGAWKDKIGHFQVDATQADIYLVSRLDRKSVIGRPNVYLAVDTATQLIAGIYVGLEAGESAFIKCLTNAAKDKVTFCKQFGIDIDKSEWPNAGLPGEIITDKGREFIGSRMEELAMKYGIEFQSLPPFRPDQKGLVEKAFDLIQQKYKPLLRGKGVIEQDAQERWAVDYRTQARLTLEEFIKVVIHCVLYLNNSRVIENCLDHKAAPVASSMWNLKEKEGKSDIIQIDPEELYLMGLQRKEAYISRRGIKYQGLWYVSKEQNEVSQRIGRDKKMQIAYDPDDMSRVFLIINHNYHEFKLSEAYSRYVGSSNEEYWIEKTQIGSAKRIAEENDTKGRLKMLKNIKEIIDQADYEDKDKVTAEEIDNNRRREAI